MPGTPQVDFALDTYECIVLYPGPSGRVLPDETVQRLQAEHLHHMQALQRRGIILIDGSVDRAGPRAGTADRLRPGPDRLRGRRAQRHGGRSGRAGRPLPGGRADLPLPGRLAGVPARQDAELDPLSHRWRRPRGTGCRRCRPRPATTRRVAAAHPPGGHSRSTPAGAERVGGTISAARSPMPADIRRSPVRSCPPAARAPRAVGQKFRSPQGVGRQVDPKESLG